MWRQFKSLFARILINADVRRGTASGDANRANDAACENARDLGVAISGCHGVGFAE